MWAILIITLPTRPNAVRLRIWRALKALGCAALRDGAYLLPLAQAQSFEALALEARGHGGQASVLELAPRHEAQRQEVLALFERSADYAAWHAAGQGLAGGLGALDEATARKRLRAHGEALAALQRTDHYPGAPAEQARTALASLQSALERQFNPGEPRLRRAARLGRLDAAAFQGQRWATRARPKIDRLACAWLIRRFIDRKAQFVWLANPARAPKGAIGFDFDGARFSHVGALVTFEVLLARFALDHDEPLQRLARVVRFLDAGGEAVPEAAGIHAVLMGLRETHADDDRLVRAAAAVFDALYAPTPATT